MNKTDKQPMNILKDNGKYHFFNALTIEKTLAPKNYIFNYDDFGNCWLEDAEDFKVPEKIYDVSSDFRNLIMRSYNSYDKNQGVLLTGNKGQGKSLTAKLLCKDLNVPVILITKSIPKEVNFVKFFNNIKQNHCIFIDEFEKLFSQKRESGDNNEYHEQEVFLSFMDGVLTNEHKVLFLLTTNDTVNEFFINRPSRVKFLKEYEELPEELFHLIVDDKLSNKEYKQDLEDTISLINMNIDLLISIIDDINLFGAPFSSFKDVYNYKFEQYRYEIYTINGNTEKLDGFYMTKKKIKISDRYIDNCHVKEILKFSSSEVTYLIDEWDEDENGKDIKRSITKKATLSKQGGFKSYAF
jgi:hypothetical protein